MNAELRLSVVEGDDNYAIILGGHVIDYMPKEQVLSDDNIAVATIHWLQGRLKAPLR